MSDVFKNTISRFAGAFAGDSAQLNFAGIGDAGFLVQQLGFQYAQSITRLYEVGARDVYYVGGRTQGTVSMARVIGPRTLLAQFYETYGDVCNALNNTMSFRMRNRCNVITAKYVAKFCVIVTIGISVGAQEMVIGENSQLMFSSLEYAEQGGALGDLSAVAA